MHTVHLYRMRSLFSLVTALLAAGASAEAADWPQFLGPTRDGVATETGLTWQWAANGPRRVWEYAIGSGWSSPVTAGGRMLIFHRVEDDAILDCLNATDGKRLWRHSRPTDYRD